MKIAGIIAEYDPLTRGHQLHMAGTRRLGATHLAVVLSGAFTQRGEPALVSKACRVRMALDAGADLVLELPLPYAMSSARNFALGGVSVLRQLGVVEALSFGSESGDPAALAELAELLDSPAFSEALRARLAAGVGFAAARQQAAEALGGPAHLLSCPNDTLGVEYLLAARRLGADWTPMVIPRQGAAHNAGHPDCPSAGAVRSRFRTDPEGAAALLPGKSRERFLAEWKAGRTVLPERLDAAVLWKLKMLPESAFAVLPDISEGLEHRLAAAVREAATLPELLERCKAKRYPTARLRRLLLAAFLDLDCRFWNRPVPYLRVLGIGKGGREILTAAREKATAPLVSRTREILALGEPSAALLEAERRATAVWGLAQERPEALDEYRFRTLRAD